MPVYVCIYTRMDSRRLNEKLEGLQKKGAKIRDIKMALGATGLVYLVIYESEEPLC